MPVSGFANVGPPKSIPPLHGLLQSARVVDPSEEAAERFDPAFREELEGELPSFRLYPDAERWEGGFIFQPENCTRPDTFNPCATTSEIQQVVVDATSGTWDMDFGGDVTAAIDFDATAFDVQQALEALPSIDVGDVIVTGGPGDAGGTTPYTIDFTGQYFEVDVADIVAASIDLAGGAATATASVIQEAGEQVEKSAFFDPTTDVAYEPYQVEVPYECSTFGWLATEYERRALEQLELGKSKAIENEFWTGSKNPANPSLVRSTPNTDDSVLNPGGAAAPIPVSPGLALALFAQALSNCANGTRGMIHATPSLAERWLNLTALVSVPVSGELGDIAEFISGERVLITPGRGDIVVSGCGYPGTGPLGQPPPSDNQVWAFATGMVDVRVGPVELVPDKFSEAVDRATNTVTFRGECTAAATDDLCCRFAVLVDLCGTV